MSARRLAPARTRRARRRRSSQVDDAGAGGGLGAAAAGGLDAAADDLIDHLVRRHVERCFDIRALAHLESTVIAIAVGCGDGRDRSEVREAVRDRLDSALHDHMFELETLRLARRTRCDLPSSESA